MNGVLKRALSRDPGPSILAQISYKLSLRPKLNCFSFLGISISFWKMRWLVPFLLISFLVLESSLFSKEFHGVTTLLGVGCLLLLHPWLFWSPNCLFHLSSIPSRAAISSKPLLMAGECHKSFRFSPKSILHQSAEKYKPELTIWSPR